ncbi:MAG: hypothetical protein IJH39_01050 [Clostridia bacterium]|nr:hypothetical protein [Clostridia bacterium]
MSKSSGIVNVRMVITEEKIISNIDKVQKMINPKSKKQIVQLEEDTYFKDLVESIKSYLIDYPKKKNFPAGVYNAANGLVEYSTKQFEENTKKIEELIRQREGNIILATKLGKLVESTEKREKDWKDKVKKAENDFSEDIIETLNILGKSKKNTEEYEDALKLLNARINNLESNLHIEIDMERIEDKSKALSYIGIEIADALKEIPEPSQEVLVVQADEVLPGVQVETAQEAQAVQSVQNGQENQEAKQQYIEETTFEAKQSLWQRFKKSKFVKAITFFTRIRITVKQPALTEGKTENN